MNRDDLPVLSDSRTYRRVSNIYINPTYASTINVNLQVENIDKPDRPAYREIIRNSIQIPETRIRRRKRSRCKLLGKDGKYERLFIAYILLITLFVMTLASIGLSLMIRSIPLKFFPDCWKLAIVLASLTFLIGAYICWEDNIFGPTRQRQEGLSIHIEQMQTFAANQ